MSRAVLLVLAVAVSSAFALDCTQIQDSQIFDGSKVFIPGGSGELRPIPTNFNCIYTIKAPATPTSGFSARVTLKNGLRGVNDFIAVTDQIGAQHVINNRTGMGGKPTYYTIIPGAQIQFLVVTKSVAMNSMFSIEVDYLAAQITPYRQMKTNGEMNFVDVNQVKNGVNKTTTVTFVGNEPIHLSTAFWEDFETCYDCYIIDGTLENQHQIYNFWDLESSGRFNTSTNAITLVSQTDMFFGVVLNTLSESYKVAITALAAGPPPGIGTSLAYINTTLYDAVEIVNFNKTGIILDHLKIRTSYCDAHVIAGAPSNNSQVILDLSTKPSMPYTFSDLQAITVINKNCTLGFDVRST